MIGEGININVTLLFAQEVYERVADAYIAGLEELQKRGGDLKKMADGVMDPEGRKRTKDGWMCGLIGTFLNVFWALGCGGFVFLMILAGEEAANRPRPAAQTSSPIRNLPGCCPLCWAR